MPPTPRLQQAIRAKRHTSTCDQKPCPHQRRSPGVRTAQPQRARQLAASPTAGLPATTLRDSTSAGASVSKHSRRQPSSASSESSSKSTSSSSASSDSEDTLSDSDRCHRRRRRAKRHWRHLRSAHGHSYPQVLASPFISCVPTPDKRAIRKIKKGKYVLFDKLLSSLDDRQVGQAAKKGTTRRQV